jgi:hypothetical protein
MKQKHYFRLFSLTLSILLTLSSCTSPSVKETESETKRETETVTAEVQTPTKENESTNPDVTEESGESESQTKQEEIPDVFVESGQRYPIELNTNYHVPLGNGNVVINAAMYYTQLGTEEYRICQDDALFSEWRQDCFFLEEVFGPENGWFLWSWGGKPYDRFTTLSVNYIKEPDSYGPGFWRPYWDLMLEGFGFLNLVVDYERVAAGGPVFEVNGDLYDLYIHNHGGVWKLSLPNPVQLYEQAGDLNYLVGREAAKDITAEIVSAELPIPVDRRTGIDEFGLYHSPQDEAPFVSYPVHSVYEEDQLYFKTLYCFVENEGRWNNDGDWIHVTMEDGTEGWAKGWQLCGTTGEPPRDGEPAENETPSESQTDENQDEESNRGVLDEISERVLKRFQNQLLEYYYSDIHLMKAGIPIDVAPGSKLYYKILNSSNYYQSSKADSEGEENGRAYKVICSDQKNFERCFVETYEYFPARDEISWLDRNPPFDKEIASGSFILPEDYTIPDEEEYKSVVEQFHVFWDKWLSEDAETDLVSPLKNAYLMPFTVEEDGSADLCIFLEEANGTWLMVRPGATRYGYYLSDSSEKREMNWNQSESFRYITDFNSMLSAEAQEFYEKNQRKSPNNSAFAIYRAYEPSGSDYAVYSYEYFSHLHTNLVDHEGNPVVGYFSAPKKGIFLSQVPNLALEHLYNNPNPSVHEETPVPTLTPTVTPGFEGTPGLSGGGSLISRGRYIMLDGSLMWVSEKMDSKEDYSDYVLGTAEYIGDKDNIPEEDGKTNYRAYAGAQYAFKDGNWYLYTDGSWCRLAAQT